MSLLFLEGFDDGLWSNRTSGLNGTDVGAAFGLDGNGARVGDNINRQLNVPVPSTKYTLGFAFNINDIGTGRDILLDFATGAIDVELRYDAGGNRLAFYFDMAVDRIYYSPSGSVSVGEWHYLEVELQHGSADDGTFKWWLNGTLLDEATDIDYKTALRSAVNFGGNSPDDIDLMYVDNIYVIDALGGFNDTALGPLKAVSLLPTGNGNSSQMLGSDGNSVDNHLLVDENPPNTTDYVGSSTEGDKDTYVMDDLAGTPVIRGIITSLYAAKTDAGAKFLRPIVRSAAADYAGASQGLAQSYSLHEEVWDKDPATSAQWLAAAVDAMEIGQEIRDS